MAKIFLISQTFHMLILTRRCISLDLLILAVQSTTTITRRLFNSSDLRIVGDLQVKTLSLRSNMIAQKIVPSPWWTRRRYKVDHVTPADNRETGSRAEEVRWGVEEGASDSKEGASDSKEGLVASEVASEEVVAMAEGAVAEVGVVLALDAKRRRTVFRRSQ